VRVGIRPSDLQLSPTPGGGPNEIGGDVVDETFLGEQILLKVKLGPEIVFDVKAHKRNQDRWLGHRVYCRCDPDSLLLFAEN
jgi:ABC-type Fe3+/spermidine/putrescine transport system ATPase subunit